MKKMIVLIAVAVTLAACVVLQAAESMSIQDIKFKGNTIEYVGDTITIDGKATILNLSKLPIQPGQMRLDSLVAKSIRIDLVKGADKRMSAKTAVAEGGVTVEARRSNVSKDQPPVIQNLHAVAQTATMQTDADKIILSGDVVVKVIEPGLSEPVNTIVGNRVIFSMKENKMRVEGESDKPAEITMTQKEKPKSETGQK